MEDAGSLAATLAGCSQLRELGPLTVVSNPFHPSRSRARLQHLSYLHLGCLSSAEPLPTWLLSPSGLHSLVHLVVETWGITGEMVLQLAKLTTLTCLQLNTALAVVEMIGEGWVDLSLLGQSLPALQRLELVSCHNGMDYDAVLSLPDLSSFSRLRQLRLACTGEPSAADGFMSAADFVSKVSRYTQIEQPEVIGYDVVVPVVICALIERMPWLKVLEVCRCGEREHPPCEYGEGWWEQNGVQMELFRPVQEMYMMLCPDLEFRLSL